MVLLLSLTKYDSIYNVNCNASVVILILPCQTHVIPTHRTLNPVMRQLPEKTCILLLEGKLLWPAAHQANIWRGQLDDQAKKRLIREATVQASQ